MGPGAPVRHVLFIGEHDPYAALAGPGRAPGTAGRARLGGRRDPARAATGGRAESLCAALHAPADGEPWSPQG
ncbi:hypothetical protein [Kocuria rhizosphaericola]|uniref:hypothetical protein n=1 Tax=Kocuria rhizosphaericola TaxID=3376284 RepID=UPI00379D01D6